MAHHKRGRPKSTRAGCLMCKPNKRQGAKALTSGPRPAMPLKLRRVQLRQREQEAECS